MENNELETREKNLSWLKKLGLAGFLFFLFKGLGWLAFMYFGATWLKGCGV